MTIKEIQETAQIKFDFVAKSDDGKILFAGPIPEFYHGGGLEYVLTEEGPVEIPDCQIDEWIAAWNWFMADLCWTAWASDAPDDLTRPLRRVNRTAAKARSAGAVVRPPTSRCPRSTRTGTRSRPARTARPTCSRCSTSSPRACRTGAASSTST